ncbi:MAG: DNA mismatch repair endonuclease MutL [Lachnospiraceae bacterium]|nr:DNA mismatch repair endonuclease MutL [Lachnospiraceae bacterium]
MTVINILDHSTVDRIAAGEVVERPFSVVKELTENAMDAGADHISVEIKEGGINFIRVTDNGCGIDADQIRKAFLRHATSKIKDAEDLGHITSLGFRGEALSSISAVAQVEVITKTADQLTGIRYYTQGGDEGEVSEVGAPDGTTMVVRNLFFNTPVRRKFLKSATTEASYITELMEHLMLSHPDVSFQYKIGNQLKYHTTGNGDLKEVIYRIYGKDFSDHVIPIEAEQNGVKVRGFLGKPICNRSNRTYELTFINGRFVKSTLLQKAIEDGYHRYLMQHQYPFVVLHIEIDPDLIDVNVHPTKMDVRFSNSQYVFDFLSGNIAGTLKINDMVPDTVLATDKTREEIKEEVLKQQEDLKEFAAEPFEVQRIKTTEELASARVLGDTLPEPEVKKPLPTLLKTREQIFVERPVFEELNIHDNDNLTVYATEETSVKEEPTLFGDGIKLGSVETKIPEQAPVFKIYGQIFDTYLLIGYNDMFYICDQHAAHEKVNFERFMKRLKQDGKVPSQLISPPVIMSLPGKEMTALEEYNDELVKMGFVIEKFGGNEIAVREAPMDLYSNQLQELIHEILDTCAEGTFRGNSELVENRIATMACKASIKGNQRISMAEAEELLKELFTLENPYLCPHGRPTLISMSKQELDKKFKRIV